jgi:hypothetical protein
MFAVPEVDDDIHVSTAVNATKPITLPEAKKESLPSSPPPSATSVEKAEKNPIKPQVPPPPPPPPVPAKQHRSRRSLFHRNTIHVCDQIVDRM